MIRILLCLCAAALAAPAFAQPQPEAAQPQPEAAQGKAVDGPILQQPRRPLNLNEVGISPRGVPQDSILNPSSGFITADGYRNVIACVQSGTLLNSCIANLHAR